MEEDIWVKKEKVKGQWIKMHSAELHGFHS
jgi:hypothetical protein